MALLYIILALLLLMPAKIKQNVLYKPQSGPQTWFHQSGADVVAYGGARGGGKSEALIFEATRFMSFPGYKGLISRRTFPQLSELISRAHNHYPKLGYTWRAGDKTYTSPQGGTIKFMSFKDEKKVEDVVGHEYQFLGVDQVEQYTQTMIEVLETCVRSSIPGLEPKIRYTSNPGSVGHLWFKDRFVDKCRPKNFGEPIHIPQYNLDYQPVIPGDPYQDENGLTNLYIPARVFDNPFLYLNDPKYVRRLMNLSPKMRNAHLLGDYDTFVGQFFDTWNYDTHVVDPFAIPYDWHCFGGYDWGYSSPSAYYVGAISHNQDIYICREFYEPRRGIDYQAAKIKGLESNITHQMQQRLADPSIWNQKYNPDLRKDRGKNYAPTDDTIESLFAEYDVPFSPANNDRINGWAAFREMLNHRSESLSPNLYFFNTCTEAIRTIPAMVHDSNKPEDLDTHTEDHACDAIRYMLMAINAPERAKAKKHPWGDVADHVIKKKQFSKGRRDGVIRYS